MHDKRIKKLMEQKTKAVEAMEAITAGAVDENGEERAMTEEEISQFEALEAQVKNIDKNIEIERRALAAMPSRESVPEQRAENGKKETDESEEQRAEKEERAFADFLRGNLTEERAGELTFTGGQATVPTRIANKIITKVYDICPIARMATRYNVKGTISIPYYPATVEGATPDIQMAYATEFTALTSTAGNFATIDLQAFLAGVLTKVSKSLVNNSQFDILNFVIDHMAEEVARWIEKEMIIGTQNKIAGLSGVPAAMTKTAAAAAAITTDELIDVQDMVKDAFQSKCCWIMSPSTRNAIRKLKDGQGNYILEHNFSEGLDGDRILGKRVYVSDNMPAMAAGAKAIYYGDFSGLALKVSESFSIEVLRENFATEHAIGVVGFLEIDSKIENEQKIACLKMKAS